MEYEVQENTEELVCQGVNSGLCEGEVRKTIDPFLEEIRDIIQEIVVCDYHYGEIADEI